MAPTRRPKLTRAEQRYNYAIGVVAVLALAVLILVSQQVVIAVLVGAFLFGLGQMVIGISRRRRYLRSLLGAENEPGAPV